MTASAPVSAVSFDFFNTLVTHRHGRGRGALVTEYFRTHGWAADPWEHDVLYDVFAEHGDEFSPDATTEVHDAFCVRVARALFHRLRVQADIDHARAHARALWRILGPDHLVLFPDVEEGLHHLRASGYRLIITSNWPRGLAGFCRALGVSSCLEGVIASGDVGVAKPDARIFVATCERLGLQPDQVLHVGDSQADDVAGARNAGMQALLLDRSPDAQASRGSVASLRDVATLLGGVR